MFKELRDFYDLHNWLKYITWVGLLLLAILLIWSLFWAMHVSAVSYPFIVIALVSTIWFLACLLFCWLSLALIRHHVRQWRILDQKRLHNWQALCDVVPTIPSNNRYETPLPLAFSVTGSSGQSVSTGTGTIADPIAGLRLPQRTLATQEIGHYASQFASTPHESITPGSMPTYMLPKSSVSNASNRPQPSSVSPSLLHIQFAKIGVGWNTGIKRRHRPNEDGLTAIQGTCTYKDQLVPFDLFIVADGMGGHADGQEASRLAIQNMTPVVLRNLVMSNEISELLLVEILKHGVQQANQAIWRRNHEMNSDMGTTLTAALIIGDNAYVVNVGDSRTYLYRQTRGLLQITRDHSLVARLVANGVITPDEMYTHPSRNLVERGLGDKQYVEVDHFIVELCKGDWLLLCSDGLWEMVRDMELAQIMSSGNAPEEISDLLVQAALDGGGMDNVSVIVARVM